MPVVVMGSASSRVCDFIRGQRVARPPTTMPVPDGVVLKETGPLDGVVFMERLRLRHVAEDHKLMAEVPFEQWSDLTRTEMKKYKKQHQRHLAECQAIYDVIFTEET